MVSSDDSPRAAQKGTPSAERIDQPASSASPSLEPAVLPARAAAPAAAALAPLACQVETRMGCQCGAWTERRATKARPNPSATTYAIRANHEWRSRAISGAFVVMNSTHE